MGEAVSKSDEVKAMRAKVREHNLAMAQLARTASRNGHEGMAHNLAGSIGMSRLDVDLLRARAACGSDVA